MEFATDVAVRPSGDAYVEVVVELVKRESTLDFDLFLRAESGMVLYRHRDQPFTREAADRLLENKVETLWVRASDERALGRHIEDHLDEILDDPSLPVARKAKALYTASRSLAIDILQAPDDAKLRRTRPLVSTTVSALMRDPGTLTALLEMLDSRYKLHSHCVNVSIYTVAFARQLGHRELAELTEIALGGLLHDLGKSKISQEILDKPDTLDEAEWAVMRKHPEWGVEILGPLAPGLGQATEAIASHHEAWNGDGYPVGLAETEIPLAARIVAVADSFDALTTERTYRPRYSPFDALAIMTSDMQNKFDSSLLKQFIPVWGPRGSRAYE